MVLVEVVELVVNVNGGGDVTVNVELKLALIVCFVLLALVVLADDALDALTHNVESNSQGEEDEAEDSKDDHC